MGVWGCSVVWLNPKRSCGVGSETMTDAKTRGRGHSIPSLCSRRRLRFDGLGQRPGSLIGDDSGMRTGATMGLDIHLSSTKKSTVE